MENFKLTLKFLLVFGFACLQLVCSQDPERTVFWSCKRHALDETHIILVRGDPEVWIPDFLAEGSISVSSLELDISLYNVWTLAADYQSDSLFWNDGGSEQVGLILRYRTTNSTEETVAIRLPVQESPITVDWVSQNVYWASRESRSPLIGMVSYKTGRAALVTTDVINPLAVAVAPNQGFLFWSEGGGTPAVKRSKLDGSSIETIVSLGLNNPTLLTVDHLTQTLYWWDEGRHALASSSLDGSNVLTVTSEVPQGTYTAMDIYKDYIFLARSDIINAALLNKRSGSYLSNLNYTENGIPPDADDVTCHGLSVMAPENQAKISSVCEDNNGNCQHICIHDAPTGGATCACEFGFTRESDGRSCVSSFVEDDFLLVTDSFAEEIYQIELLSGTVHTLPIGLHDNPLGIQYNYKEKEVYWADHQLKVIRKAALDGSNQQDVITLQDGSNPVGLALDLAQGRTYYTDEGLRTIEYVDQTGSRTVVLRLTAKPRDIVLDIFQRVMYWTSVGVSRRIEKANMDDASHRAVLVNTNLGSPNGLAIDFSSQQIFWTDSSNGRVEQMNLDGSNRKTLYRDTSGALWGIALDSQNLYVTDFHRRYVRQIDRRTRTVRTVGPGMFGRLNYMHLYSSSFRNLGISISPRDNGCDHVINSYNIALMVAAAFVTAINT